MSRSVSQLGIIKHSTDYDLQVPGHAHVRHLGPPEDGHEGCGPPAGAGPAAREGLLRHDSSVSCSVTELAYTVSIPAGCQMMSIVWGISQIGPVVPPC